MTGERRSQAERREQTRQALLDAALDQMDSGVSFDRLSLRRVTHLAGVVPTAFDRHFATMDELALVLVEESVQTLRSMLRAAREGGPPAGHVIESSVRILVEHVRAHPRHFAFIATSGRRATPCCAIRSATRSGCSPASWPPTWPVSRSCASGAPPTCRCSPGLVVDAMIASIDSLLEAAPRGGPADTPSPQPRPRSPR